MLPRVLAEKYAAQRRSVLSVLPGRIVRHGDFRPGELQGAVSLLYFGGRDRLLRQCGVVGLGSRLMIDFGRRVALVVMMVRLLRFI